MKLHIGNSGKKIASHILILLLIIPIGCKDKPSDEASEENKLKKILIGEWIKVDAAGDLSVFNRTDDTWIMRFEEGGESEWCVNFDCYEGRWSVSGKNVKMKDEGRRILRIKKSSNSELEGILKIYSSGQEKDYIKGPVVFRKLTEMDNQRGITEVDILGTWSLLDADDVIDRELNLTEHTHLLYFTTAGLFRWCSDNYCDNGTWQLEKGVLNLTWGGAELELSIKLMTGDQIRAILTVDDEGRKFEGSLVLRKEYRRLRVLD